MSRPALLRTLSLTPDGTMPADQLPPGLAELGVAAARKGGPIVFEWRIEFVDDDGAIVVGGTEGSPDPGTATVAWHSIRYRDPELLEALLSGPYAFRSPPAIETQALIAPLEVDGSELTSTTLPAGAWAWPRLTAITAPEVLPKSIRLTVGGTGDGTWSIAVDAEEPLEFAASGDTAEQIRDGLVALFVGHETVTAEADDVETDELVITAIALGDDFALTLDSPADALTQAAEQPVGTAATGVRVYMIVDRAAP